MAAAAELLGDGQDDGPALAAQVHPDGARLAFGEEQGDSHAGQGAATGSQQSLFTQLDDAVQAFYQDMTDMGQWNNTVIMVITEFGRRNEENGSPGTDQPRAAASAASFAKGLSGSRAAAGRIRPRRRRTRGSGR